MSYSRWGSEGSGHWYTYWCAPYGNNKETRDNAMFEICMVYNFKAKELRKDINRCLTMVKERDPEATNEQIAELRTYMEEFLNDIDNEYLVEATQC